MRHLAVIIAMALHLLCNCHNPPRRGGPHMLLPALARLCTPHAILAVWGDGFESFEIGLFIGFVEY
jgi:hypothetical protein